MSAARPRDCVTARLQVSAPGHDDDVAGELGAGLGHADARRGGRSSAGSCGLGEVAQREVLAVGDADVDAEVALDLGEAAELVGGDVAEAAVRVRAHGAVGAAAHDVGGSHRCVRRRVPRTSTGDARADEPAVGATVGAHAGGRVAAARDDLPGMPPGQRGRRAEELALLEDALAQLVDAHRVDEPLHAGAQLVVAVAVVVERAQARLDRRQQVLAAT